MGNNVAASRRLPGQRFITQRKALAIDDQTDAQLFAIGPMIAGVAALGLGIAIHTPLEVGAGQVVQQKIVGKGEEIASSFGQVLFNGLLVRFDQTEAAIQLVEG